MMKRQNTEINEKTIVCGFYYLGYCVTGLCVHRNFPFSVSFPSVGRESSSGGNLWLNYFTGSSIVDLVSMRIHLKTEADFTFARIIDSQCTQTIFCMFVDNSHDDDDDDCCNAVYLGTGLA